MTEMKLNMGNTDRLIRSLIVGPLLLIVAWSVGFGSTLGIIAVALAVVMWATSAVGTCPLYLPFGISTLARGKQGGR